MLEYLMMQIEHPVLKRLFFIPLKRLHENHFIGVGLAIFKFRTYI
jgi:hypothetical protein